MTRFSVVIPARYGSTRLAGKPLIDLAGKSMIQRVCEQAGKSQAEQVVVATDDTRIVEAVEQFGGQAVMTDAAHETGTDRVHEAVSQLGLGADDVIVNVQGDEPLIPPEAINQVASLIDEQTLMATLCEPVGSYDDLVNPNVVKVVMDQAGRALYFSRAPIPYAREGFPNGELLATGWFRHLGIYAYTAGLLKEFVSWPPAQIEQLEKLEQLRVLANGKSIGVAVTDVDIPPGIDVAEDVARVESVLNA